MKKCRIRKHARVQTRCMFKLLLIMKLSTVILSIATLQVFAAGGYSQETDLTLNLGETSVAQVLTEIENQSEFYFLFNQALVDTERKVNVQITDKKIEDVLDQIFDGTTTGYMVMDRQIVLSPEHLLSDAKGAIQARTLTGSIIDSDGVPLIGVSVSVKGTSIGTISDADGKFSLSDIPENATLVISYVGMLTQEIPVGNQTTIEILMESDYLGLEEVVVVGYGTQKKINLTGAVSVAGKKDIENRPVSNVQQALQGLVPNLVIAPTIAGGEPGAEMGMNIRGLTSFANMEAEFNGDLGSVRSGPYILVDGIPMDMNDVDPNDIESVSVLKDAASTAIYGARAAYGVILITTKQGEQGTRVSYAGNFGWSAPTIWPDFADPMSTVHAHNDAAVNAGAAKWYNDDAIERLEQNLADPGSAPGMMPKRNGLNWDIENTGMKGTANEDWRSIIFNELAPRQKHNLSISGGNESINYYLSGGFFKEEGLLKQLTDDYTRYNIDAKINANATSWMKLNFLVKYRQGLEEYPWTQGFGRDYMINWLNKIKPGTPSKYPGTDIWTTQSGMGRYQASREEYTKRQLVISPRIILEPVKGWVTNLEFNYRTNTNDQNITINQFYWMRPNGELVYTPPQSGTEYTSNMYLNTYMSPNIYSTYTRSFGKHNLIVLAGYQHETYEYSNLLANSTYLLSDATPSISTSVGEYTVDDRIGHSATQSLFGRLNYNFSEKYLFEFNLRWDGSSRFEPDERWGTFPSFSAGWVFSQENFFPLKDQINFLKFRASYGSLGNQNVANYLYIPTMSVDQSYWLFGDQRLWTVWTEDATSINLTWEKVNTIDFGVDLRSLKNRLTATFDWYESKTTELVGPGAVLPAVTGMPVPKRNEGEITTRGWELEITWKDRAGDFSYGFRGILSDYISRVTKYNNPTKILSTYDWWGWEYPSYYDGKVIGEIWGFESAGLYQSDADIEDWGIDQNYIYSGAWYPGDLKYVDKDGDEAIAVGENTLDDHGDLVVLGNNTPRFQYGLSANATWKGFDFSMLWQGVAKRDLDLRTRGTFRGPADAQMHATCYVDHLDYWRDDTSPLGANPDAYFPRPYSEYTGSNDKNFGYPTNRYLQNGAYIRLKNLQLGYTIPSRITRKIFVTRARIYVSGENLLTFTKLMFYDPEAFSGRYYGPGDAYPLSRTISLGLNVNF